MNEAKHHADMLEVHQLQTDALEGIQVAVEALANYESKEKTKAPAPVVNVTSPSVTVAAPPPANVNVNVPAAPKKWTCEIVERDTSDRIKKFTLTAT